MVPCTVIHDKFVLHKLHSYVKYTGFIMYIKQQTYLFTSIGEE